MFGNASKKRSIFDNFQGFHNSIMGLEANRPLMWSDLWCIKQESMSNSELRWYWSGFYSNLQRKFSKCWRRRFQTAALPIVFNREIRSRTLRELDPQVSWSDGRQVQQWWQVHCVQHVGKSNSAHRCFRV